MGVRQQKNHALGLAEQVCAEDNTDSGSRKKPRVSKVSGRVSNTSKGQSTALAKPRSSAETIRLDVLAKRMPLKTRLATHKERAVMPS